MICRQLSAPINSLTWEISSQSITHVYNKLHAYVWNYCAAEIAGVNYNRHFILISAIILQNNRMAHYSDYELRYVPSQIQCFIKDLSFNVWVRYFVWNFKGTLWNSTQNISPIHWKIWLLYNIEILRALRFKSSFGFLKRPPGLIHWLWGNHTMAKFQ